MEIVSKIIEYINDELRISHRIIAEKTDNLEKSVRNIITKYKSDFEEFGQVHFKNATVRNSVGAVNEQITYFLNEQQSTLLLTYLKNSKMVREFKKTLVRDFFELKNVLEKSPQAQLSELQETLDFIDIFEKFSEKTKGKSNLELLKLDSFLKKSDKKSVLDILNLDLKNSYFSVSELGEFSGQKGSEINQALVKVGFQISENGVWKLLENGKDFCFETQNSFSQLKWKFSVLEKI